MVVQQLMVQKGLRYKLYQELVPEARLRSISVTNLFIVGLVLLSFLFLALPLRIRGGTASPLRPVALC